MTVRHFATVSTTMPAGSPKDLTSSPLPGRSQDVISSELFCNALLDSLPDGVIVVTRTLKLVHLNLKARELCQKWITPNYGAAGLPSIISETCHRFLRQAKVGSQPLFMEYPVRQGITLRIRAQWLPLTPQQSASASPAESLIMLMLRDCDDALREELLIEQQKYDLTEREAEIWSLLRQEKTYQEIAEMLQISLNTVKTHVKNVYAKKRSVQGNEKVIVL